MRRRLSQSPLFSQDRTGRALPQMIPTVLLITLIKCYACPFLCENFFHVSPLTGSFIDQFPSQEFFLGIVTPPPVISDGLSLYMRVFTV